MIKTDSKLSRQLLKSILTIYFSITLTVTLLHFIVEYNHIKNVTKDEIKKISSTFTPAITTALWELNDGQLETICNGIYKIPLIYGIIIKDPNNKILIQKIKQELHQEEIDSKEYAYAYTIKKQFHDKNINLAEVTLYSDNSAVFNRLKLEFTMILLNAIIKSLALLILFVLAFNKYLKYPLENLTKKITHFNWDNPKQRKLDVPFNTDNELSLLQNEFNKLLQKISHLEEEKLNLANKLNLKLEQEVKERTKELTRQKDFQDTLLQGITKAGLNLSVIEDGKFIYTNNHDAAKEYGYDAKKIHETKPDFLTTIHPEDKEKVMEIYKKRLKGEDVPSSYTVRILRQNGDIEENEITSILVPNTNPVQTIVVAKDITQLKKLESQTKLASMGEMIGNIAHQWRQPLNIISVSTSGMILKKEMGILKDKELFDYGNTILNSTEYLSQTIDDFRDFIKGDRIKKSYNIGTFIGKFSNLINASAKNHQIELLKNIDKNIDMIGYPNDLMQCLMNLYSNAKDVLDQKEKNEPRLISIEIFKKDEQLHIIFKDNGGGIPKEILPKIFDPYFTTKHQSQGTGLGLHMSYKLIKESMHGSIEALNEEFQFKGTTYKGAKFIIKLPLNDL